MSHSTEKVIHNALMFVCVSHSHKLRTYWISRDWTETVHESVHPVKTCLLCYCTLLNCESFIHVDIVSLFICHSCVPPTFLFEWNKEILDLVLFLVQVVQCAEETPVSETAEIVEPSSALAPAVTETGRAVDSHKKQSCCCCCCCCCSLP